MIVKTKKYQLTTKTYVRVSLKGVLLQQWWVVLIALGIMAFAFIWPSIWWIIGGLLGYGLYVVFWLVQFAGVTQHEQAKVLFERLNYEIDSQKIVIKLNAKQGMPIKWENIKRAKMGKDHFLLHMNKVQVIYLPFKIFNSDNERRFIETILKRKGYVKEDAASPIAAATAAKGAKGSKAKGKGGKAEEPAPKAGKKKK